MALKFGPQWLRDLTDVRSGSSSTQPPAPSYGVKFKLADHRYGREEMLALYNENYSPPDELWKHQAVFSKENQRPISMTSFSQDEQRLMSQGINSHIVLRGGRGGGISERGRGRGRGRGEGFISRQPENGEQPFVRQLSSDGWEQVGRKPDRSYTRSYEDTAPPVSNKREYLRSSSNNWRDKKQENEEEDGSGHWRTNRENPRWGSARPNWRQPAADYDESRPQRPRDIDTDPRGPRRISESYDNEVPEWAGDDVGDDPGTFDAKGVFVSTRFGMREIHGQEHHRGSSDAQNIRKRIDTTDEIEKQDSSSDNPSVTNRKAKPNTNLPVQSENGITFTSPEESSKLLPTSTHAVISKTESSPKTMVTSHSGDGDSINHGLIYPPDKSINTSIASSRPVNRQEPMYPTSHPTENISLPELKEGVEHEHPTLSSMTSTENILRMEKSLQNLLAGITSKANNKSEEEIDFSKGALPLTHKDANKWFYRDPQGKVQGPFSSESMAEWFRIGYFTMKLIVKRGCDDSFKQLGELIKQYGRVPFVPGPPLPPIITHTSVPEEIKVPTEIPRSLPSVITMPSMVSPMMPGIMGPTMPSLHDSFMIRSMMLQQEYLKQQLMMQQLQMQTMAKLQEQESFKDYTPEQQHDIVMRMMMQNNPLLMQQMQQLQHQQVLLQQQQQQQQQHPADLHALPGMGLDTTSSASDPFQHPISHPSTHITTPTVPSTTLPHSSSPANEKEIGGPVWANSQHTENSIWSQPQTMWDTDGINEAAYKDQMEKLKREREEERLKEEERIQQELIEIKRDELRKQQSDLERQREQVRREKEELERDRELKLEEVRKEEERLLQLELERQKKEHREQEMRRHEEKRRHEEERKKEQELRKQEEKRRKEKEKLVEDQRRQEEAKRNSEIEEIRQRQAIEEMIEAKRREEMQRQQELQQIQEEDERMKREIAEKEKQQQALKKQQMESQRQQESLRKLQQAQREQLANIQLPASSNWAKQASHGGLGHSKSLTEIQEEEARKERDRQKEQQAQKERLQEQVAFLSQQQIQSQKSWALHASKGIATRGLSLLDIQQQEKENAKKSDKGKPQVQPAKPSLGSGSTWMGTNTGLWGTNSTWESVSNPSPVSTGGIWDMGVPQSIKKPQLGKNTGGLAASQNTNQQQQSKKNAKASNKKAAAPTKQKEVENIQKLFQQNKKQDGFSEWVTEKLSQFSSDIDIPTFVSFIVEVDSPDDVLDYVKTYLGDTKETQDFSRQFLEKRNQCKNQMRLQKQLEEDSIWGPAPAINPHTTHVSDGSKMGNSEGAQGKSKNKKKKKAQKLDGSILGFTVSADPNRKNATGQFETID